MSQLLKDLNKAGLIEKLDGDDERFTKIEMASTNIAKELKNNPPLLIRAITAGLDPDISADDPLILMAEEALLNVWTSMRSIHTEPPIFIYRAVLIDACNQASDGINSTILWGTAADTLPIVRLGREENVIRTVLTQWARNSEELTLISQEIEPSKRAPVTKTIGAIDFDKIEAIEIDQDDLKDKIAAAVGPNYRSEQHKQTDFNKHWSHQQQHWSWDFADQMTNTLAKQLDSVYESMAESNNSLSENIRKNDENRVGVIQDLLKNQRSWMQDTVKSVVENTKNEQLRLNTLWWCEALYSPSYHRSYREFDPMLATVTMALDLLDEVQTETPASVGYALSETVNKLPNMEFNKEYPIFQILDQLGAHRINVPSALVNDIIHPPESGRLSIRDLVISVLLDIDDNLELLVERTGLDKDFKICLPRLAQAIFRQEQAVRIAGVK